MSARRGGARPMGVKRRKVGKRRQYQARVVGGRLTVWGCLPRELAELVAIEAADRGVTWSTVVCEAVEARYASMVADWS